MPTTPRVPNSNVKSAAQKPVTARPAPPPVYRPTPTPSQAAPPHRPQPLRPVQPFGSRGAVQGQRSITSAPPVYNPSRSLQRKVSGPGIDGAPPVYRPTEVTPAVRTPGVAARDEKGHRPIAVKPVPALKPVRPPAVQRANPPLYFPQKPSGARFDRRPGRAVIQRMELDRPGTGSSKGEEYVPFVEAPLALPEGITLKMGGKLAELEFGLPDVLVKSGSLLKYLGSEAGCKELCDQYEVWLTARSIEQRLPNKEFKQKKRRVYYVAHGSAKQKLFDDKDASGLATSLILDLQLDQHPIVEALQIRLVGCYSAALVDDITQKIKKNAKVKFGEGGSVTVKGTIGTYFRRGEQSQMLTLDSTGEGRAQPFFDISNKAIKTVFGRFESECLRLRDELHGKMANCLSGKDSFLFAFLEIKTAGQGKPLIAKFVKPAFKVPSTLALLNDISAALKRPQETGNKEEESSFRVYCVGLITRFEKLQIMALQELMETRDVLLTDLFRLEGKGVVAKGLHQRHVSSSV